MPDLTDKLLDRLGVVNAMAHRATTAAGKIKEAAGGREQSSAAEVEGLRAQIRKAGIGEDPDAEKRYCRLLMDRGRLAQAFTLAEQDEGRFDDLSPVSTSLRKGLSMGEFDLYGAAFEYADDLPPVRLNGPDYDVALFEFHDNLYAGPEVFASYLRGAAGEDPVLGEFGAWLEKAARRKAAAGQATFDFDAEAHPRAPKGGAHGGEFVKRSGGGGGEATPSAAADNVIASFENSADGVKSFVARVPGGYSVSVQDTDSGEFLPTVVIVKDLADATRRAQRAAGGDAEGVQSDAQATAAGVSVEGRAPHEMTEREYGHPQIRLSFIDKIMAAKQGERVGVVGDLLKGPNIRGLFSSVLDVPVVVVNTPMKGGKPQPLPEGYDFWGALGTMHGETTVFVSNKNMNKVIRTVLEEAAHAMRKRLGRPMTSVDWNRMTPEQYGNLPEERSAAEFVEHALNAPEKTHEDFVREALMSGKAVPQDNLDYYRLKPPAPAPWTMSAARYQHLAGVEQPFMMEISSHQMGLMSERQKKRYMADRAAQWDASAAVKGEWREKVIAAWDAGEITPQTPGLDPEAKAAITTEQVARDQQEAKGRVEAALDANQITAAEQVKVGDRVFDLLSGRYGTVEKKFKSGVRFAPENREGGYHMEPYTVNARRLQWQSYNDAQAAAGGEPLAKGARQDTPDGDTAMPPAAAMGTGMQPQGAEQPEVVDELNERHKRDKSLGVGELDVPEEAVPQPQPARGADGKPLAEYPQVKKAATREYVPPDMPRWKKHPGGEAYLPLNGVENRDKYRGMVAAFEDGSFTWYTPLVRCGDQLITGSHRYNAAKAAGAQVQTVTLDELFRENGQDFQTLWGTYAQPFDGWLSNLSYCLEFLPAEVKAAYGIDLG